jgi:hypothetical protein
MDKVQKNNCTHYKDLSSETSKLRKGRIVNVRAEPEERLLLQLTTTLV